jgi:hypothetical protein
MKSPAILAAVACMLTLTACGRLNSKTATDLITSSPDYQRAYIERTTVWSGRVPADQVEGPLGERTRNIGLMSCVAAGAGYYTCSLPGALTERAKEWEPHDRNGYTEYRVPLYNQKLESVEMTERSRKTAEATYQFHREPNEWGRKFGRTRPGPTLHFKAFFKKYDGKWQIDHLTETGP